jgi:NADPH:quinone reductase-like Zn-dependent oxidoreductase
MFTRQGHSPDVKLPRILGIEAVGIVEEARGGTFHKGETVVTVMGGMGRGFDGSHAEYTVVPAAQVLAVHTELPREVLGALPEMLQTAWGALHTSLAIQRGKHL